MRLPHFAEIHFFSQDNLQKQFRINDQIKADFEMAKNILKPTQKQLEHGLELHKNSLVIDAYGFMPRAAYNGELINTALNAKASSLEVQDMQEDMSMTRFVLDKKESEEFENASANFFSRVKGPVEAALKKAGLTIDDI